MTTPAAATAPETVEVVAAYGLVRPRLADARRAVERVHGADAGPVWEGLRRAASVTAETDEYMALDRVVAAMQAHADGVVRLCGRSLAIRIDSFGRLAATHALIVA